MKKSILALVVIIACYGFTPITMDSKNTTTADDTTIILEEINTFNQIIENKLVKASILENQAKLLLTKDANSMEAVKLKEQAQLERMMTLKYKAAIACRENFLN